MARPPIQPIQSKTLTGRLILRDEVVVASLERSCTAPNDGDLRKEQQVRMWSFRRAALGICAAATLAGCGGSQLPARDTGGSATTQVQAHHRVFQYTGGEQSFKVPAGVTSIDIDARGAAGGGSASYSAGRGGRVTAAVPVQPGKKLAVFVGGGPSNGTGGFNGGGNGGNYPGVCTGFGGGGASDVRESGTTLRDRILVAGGGGGGAYYGGGGAGGGKKGGNGGGVGKSYNGFGGGGLGGTQSKGGAGGAGGFGSQGHGTSGTLGVGGNGGMCAYYSTDGEVGVPGSGGGGGYYGGGGGGGSSVGATSGGGGGGSGYVEPSATNVHFQRGWKNATGDGEIILRW
jgi:Glycine rich protein